jgi:hypothetical protein
MAFQLVHEHSSLQSFAAATTAFTGYADDDPLLREDLDCLGGRRPNESVGDKQEYGCLIFHNIRFATGRAGWQCTEVDLAILLLPQCCNSQRRPKLPQKLPSDILTLQSKDIST